MRRAWFALYKILRIMPDAESPINFMWLRSRIASRAIMKCGRNLKVERSVGISMDTEVGNNVYFASGCKIDPMVRIGNDVLIAHNVLLLTSSGRVVGKEDREIVIKDHAKICNSAIILQGVTVGRQSIVAAGAVVARDIQAYSLAIGNPARIFEGKYRKGEK